ncbi:HNH endonuclease [Photobacterium profundum]|uniref:HNH endonuclease n=1 Tax=Photobacterium profundum TaxID=74109 RepID=UPI003D0B5939
MKHIKLKEKPNFASFDEISKSYFDKEKSKFLNDNKVKIQGFIQEFSDSGSTLYDIKPKKWSDEDKDKLTNCYSKACSKASKLIKSVHMNLEDADKGVCPFCGFSEEWHTDHFLPKSVFPEFSVYPKNLLPICGKCNGRKHNLYITKKRCKPFFYPLIDLESEPEFITAQAVKNEKGVVVISFSISPDELSKDEYAIAKRQFKRLDLNNRYRGQAISLFSKLSRHFSNKSLTLNAAFKIIEQNYNSSQIEEHKNHWKVVFYKSIYNKKTLPNIFNLK